jgi:hypothetical protein
LTLALLALLSCTRFGASAPVDVLVDAATPVGDASASDGSAPSSCRETLFDSFSDDGLASRWDAVVPNGGSFSLDKATFLSFPSSLLVSRLQGGGGPTLEKHATPAKSVCCEFGIQGVGRANVFKLQGLGGNFAVFLAPDPSKLSVAEVLSLPPPGVGVSRVLPATLPPPYNWTRLRVEATLPPVGKGSISIHYADALDASAGGVINDQLGEDGADLSFDTVQIGIMPSSDTAESAMHFDDFGCSFR